MIIYSALYFAPSADGTQGADLGWESIPEYDFMISDYERLSPGLGVGMLHRRLVLVVGLALFFAQLACSDSNSKLDERDSAELLSAIFSRASAEPKSIPDGQLLKERPIVVREETRESGAKVPADALKGLSGWVLRPLEALQSEADSSRALHYFVVVESVTMDGSKAVVSWGTDLTIPKRDGGVTIKLCCSLVKDRYQKRGGGWFFDKRVEQIVY